MLTALSNPRRHIKTSPRLETLDDRVMPSVAIATVHETAHVATIHHVTHPNAGVIQANAHKLHHHHHAPRANALHPGVPNMTHYHAHANAPHTTRSAVGTPSPVVTSTTGPAITATPITPTQTMPTPAMPTPTTNAVPGSPLPAPVKGTADTPLPRATDSLNRIYKEYEAYVAAGGDPSKFTSPEGGIIEIHGNMIGVNVSVAGSLTDYLAQATAIGMQVRASDTATGTVDALIPIDQLPALNALTGTVGIQPIYRPILMRF